MPSSTYYQRQAELCMRMALVAQTDGERLRLFVKAKEYSKKAALLDRTASAECLTSCVTPYVRPAKRDSS